MVRFDVSLAPPGCLAQWLDQRRTKYPGSRIDALPGLPAPAREQFVSRDH